MKYISKSAILGNKVKVFPNVYIGKNTKIGDNSVIQYGAFIENDCIIGKNSRIGTNAVLRQKTIIGDYSIFGSLSASEGRNWIGNHVLIHSQNHLTTGIIIEDYVFIAPLFVGANDPSLAHGRRDTIKFIPKAPHIKFGSALAINVTVNPAIVIGRECIIGAGSVVTKNIPDFSIAFGSPARVKKSIDERWRLPERLYKEFRERVSEKYLNDFMKQLLEVRE